MRTGRPTLTMSSDERTHLLAIARSRSLPAALTLRASPCLPGYAASLRNRKRIEPFGWGRTIGGLARPMLRGVEKLGFKFTLTMAGYNLIRLPNSSQPKHERQPHMETPNPSITFN